MKILFDNGTPRNLIRFLSDKHTVTEARARGWEEIENGDLLSAGEAAGFDILLTTDKDMLDQQNFTGRKIAVVALEHSTWEYVLPCVDEIVADVDNAKPGKIDVVPIPLPPKKPYQQ